MSMRSFSIIQEERVARKLDGQVVANSGATAFDKGDVRIDRADMLIECKTSTTPKLSQSVKKEWLDTIQKEAYAMGKSHGVVSIDFGRVGDFFIIDEKLMLYLVEKLAEDR